MANAAGASEIVPLVVDDLPSVADARTNHDPPHRRTCNCRPPSTAIPTARHSTITASPAKAGERVSLEVLATRLGWDFDPVIRVLDVAGNELARADDDPATAADPRLVFTAPADGQYVVEVRDNRYRAGGRYRIRLGSLAARNDAASAGRSTGNCKYGLFCRSAGRGNRPTAHSRPGGESFYTPVSRCRSGRFGQRCVAADDRFARVGRNLAG